MSPTHAKDEKSLGEVGEQVVKSKDGVENQVLKSRKEVKARARAPSGIQIAVNQRGYVGEPTISPVRWPICRYCSEHPGTRVSYPETQPSNDSPICMLIDRAVSTSPESRAAR